jgi:alpha-tubulin suppressor-like RCC1 family protein
MFGGIGWKIIAMAKKTAAMLSPGLFLWGQNSFYILGLGDSASPSAPTQRGTETGWTKIRMGRYSSFAIKNGDLFVTGRNDYGQLGTGNTTNLSSPVQVGSNWSDVATNAGLNNFFTVAIKTDGTLWSWGRNGYGQLGRSLATNTTPVSSPVQIGTDTNWSSVNVGRTFVHAIKTDGTLWAWGRNNYRQLGIVPITTINSPTQTITTSDWSVASGGMDFTLAVKTGGSLWSWGRNSEGQLGIGDTTNRFGATQVGSLTNWSKVTASNGYGRQCSGSIKTDGTLWTWGNNYFYNLGLGNRTNRSSPVQVGSATDWNEIKAGQDHFIGIKATNQLWLFGNGNMGQMGTNNRNNGATPFRLGTATDWTAVGAGRYTSGAIGGGKLWMWGDNSSGKLGINSSVASTSSPIQVGTGTDWSKIEISFNHSMAIKTDGTLWAWGNNNNGKHGNSSTTNTSSPVQVGTATDWVQISIGINHGAAIRTGGTLWTWGSNASGQLGQNDFTTRSSPVQVGTATDWASVTCGRDHTFAVKTNNTIWAIGGSKIYGRLSTVDGTLFYNSPVQVGTDTNWEKVRAMGQRDSVIAKRTNGTLWAWGQNTYGVLGLGDTVLRSSPIQIGSATDWSDITTLALGFIAEKTNGNLWAAGRNNYGELLLPAFGDFSSIVQVSSSTDWQVVRGNRNNGFAIKTAGSLWGWGRNTRYIRGSAIPGSVSSPVQVGSDSNWSATFANGKNRFNLLLKTNGSLFGVGLNSTGVLTNLIPIGSVFNLPTVTQIGTSTDWQKAECLYSAAVAKRTNGTLWAWGTNTDGRLGLGDVTNRSSPVQIGTGTDWDTFSSGMNHTLATKTGGTLWSWGGAPWNGHLGLGDYDYRSSPVQIGTATDWAKARTGYYSSFAIKTGGTLWSWGRNDSGQLGLGDITNRNSPVQIGAGTDWSEISGSKSYDNECTIALKTNGTMWSWGSNVRFLLNQLSFENPTAGYSPIKVGTDTNWSYIASGTTNAFAVKTTGTLWSWGRNLYGALGQNFSGVSRSSPVQIGTDINWSKVSASTTHALALKTTGTLWAWGGNANGQLGQGNTTSRSSPVQIGTATDWAYISCSGSSGSLSFNNRAQSFAIKTGGTLWAWGRNDSGQLGLGNATVRSSPVQVGTDTNWSKVQSGGPRYTSRNRSFTLALRTNGTLWSWGNNVYGQLGLGDTTARSSPVQIGTDTNWSSITCGMYFGAAIKTNGTLWIWGSNYYGQLGLGDLYARSSPVQVGTNTDWANVYGGEQFCVARKTNGTLWVWGNNRTGRFGNGYVSSSSSSPVQIGSQTDWSAFGKGSTKLSSMALKTDGTLWTWGRRQEGQGGIGNFITATSSPAQAGSSTDWSSFHAGQYHVLAIKTNGTLWAWGRNTYGQLGQNFTSTRIRSPVQIGTDADWAFCRAVSYNGSMAIKTNGTLWAWGQYGSSLASRDGLIGLGSKYQVSPVQIGTRTDWDDLMDIASDSNAIAAIVNA